MGGFKYKMDILESLTVTQFPRKLIAPTYLAGQCKILTKLAFHISEFSHSRLILIKALTRNIN